MKKLTKIILIALTLALLLAVPFAVYASDDEPSLKIEAANLSFMDSISILYAVSGENVDMSEVKLLIWTAPKAGINEYVKGTEAHVLDSERYDSIDSVNCKVFDFDKLGTHQMTDEFYARAYVEVGDKVYYSNLSKYSIIRYAHNKLGYTGTATENEILISTLESMLEYGATAQLFADYKTERLPTDRYYKVAVEGGYLSDGTSSGLYIPGDSVTITIPETDADGNPFKALVNEAGDEISTHTTTTIEVKNTNDNYIVTYETTPAYTEGLVFTLQDDDTYAVTDYEGTETDVIIPSTYEGKPVTSIGYGAFYSCTKLNKILLPNSLTSIGDYAFKDCINLDTLVLPEGVVSIGEYAFEYCNSLPSVEIPATVTSIGDYAFHNCYNLMSITVAEANAAYKSIDGNLYTKDGKTLITLCKIGASFTIPDGVEIIGNRVFQSCSSLTSVVIPDSVTSIGMYAFYNCHSLTNINYAGTKEQWDSITTGLLWDKNTGEYTINYNYKGE